MVGRQDGGEKPLDSNVEKVPQPEVGKIYKRIKRGSKNYEYVRVDGVMTETGKRSRTWVYFSAWEEGKNEWLGEGQGSHLPGKVLLETFMNQDVKKIRYIEHADSEKDFYTKENIPLINQPLKPPISAFEELSEPWSPEEKDAEGNTAPFKDSEAESELGFDQELPELEQGEKDELGEGRITKADFENLEEVFKAKRKEKTLEPSEDLDSFVLTHGGFKEGDRVTFFKGKKVWGVIEKDRSKLILVDRRGNPWDIRSIFFKDGGYIQKLGKNRTKEESFGPEKQERSEAVILEETERQELKKPVEITQALYQETLADFERRKFEESIAPTETPDDFILWQNGYRTGDELVIAYEEGRELKGKIKYDGGFMIINEAGEPVSLRKIFSYEKGTIRPLEESSEEGERPKEAGTVIPETPEVVVLEGQEREELESRLEVARSLYAEADYKHNTQKNKLAQFFGLNTDSLPLHESAAGIEYYEAVKNIRDFELQELQVTWKDLSEEEQKVKVESFLRRYRYQEQAALEFENQAIKMEQEQEQAAGKIKESIKGIGEYYRKLSFGKKMILAGGVIGLSLAVPLGAPIVSIAGVAYAARRVVTGIASYLGTKELVDKGYQYFDEKAQKKDLENLTKEVSGDFEKLRQATEEKLRTLNQELEKSKKRNQKKQIVALGVALGLPAIAHFIEFGNESSTVSSSGEYPQPTETVAATDHVEPSEGSVAGAPETPVEKSSVGGGNTEGGSQSVNPEAVGGFSLEAVTVSKGDNLWNLVEKQLPGNITDETEKNRITASVQNWIQNDIQGLTDAQIYEKYGFSSKDLDLLNEGEVIKLNAIPKEQLQAIIDGQIVLPAEVELTTAPGEAPGAPESIASVSEATPIPDVVIPSGQPEKIVIGPKDTPLSPRDQYWIDQRNMQGRFTDADEVQPEGYESNQGWQPPTEPVGYQGVGYQPEGEGVTPPAESFWGKYNYEMSTPQNFPETHKELFNESINTLQEGLRTIDHPEFGSDYRLGDLKTAEFWGEYRGDSMQDIIAFDNPRYNYDPRDGYRDYQERQIGRRGIYLDPMNPGPQLGDGPDPYAIHSMDRASSEYRHNLVNMQRAAFKTFGEAALPIGQGETVKQYMARVAVLVTRARLENPEFRLKF